MADNNREQALEFTSSSTFETFLKFISTSLIEKGIEYVTDILDEKLEEYKVPWAIREIIKWGIRIASTAFIAWFLGESIAIAIVKYLLGKLIKAAIMKLHHAFVNPPKAMLLGTGLSNRISIALSPQDAEVLKSDLIKEIESGQHKDNPDCQKCLEILKKSR